MVLLQFHFPKGFGLKTGPGSPCCGKLGHHVKVSIVSMESLFCICHLPDRPHSFVGFRQKVGTLGNWQGPDTELLSAFGRDCNLILIYKLTPPTSRDEYSLNKIRHRLVQTSFVEINYQCEIRNRYC